MKIEKLSNSEVAFEIIKDGEEFKSIKEKVLNKFKNVKVDGFRKGKVPLDVIEKTFANDIRDEIVNEILSKEYSEVLKSGEIKPVSELAITGLEYKADSIKMNFKVAVFPEFELSEYKNLGVTLEEVSASDEEVEAELKKLQERSKKFEKVEREEAKLGDIAIIDFEGFVDGVAFEGGKASNHRLELGSKTFIDTFEEQIVGHKLGEEFDVNVRFPKEYHSENLKDKEAVFKVKLNSLEEAILPELNDEFAKASGSDSLDDLRKAIKGNLLSNKEARAKNNKLTTIVEKLAETNEFEVPGILVEQEIEAQISRFVSQLQMQGMNLETYLSMVGTTIDKMREDLRERAAKGVKISFILNKIAEKEEIKVSEEEFNKEFENMAAMYGMTTSQLEEELNKTNGLDRFYNQINSQLFYGKINEFLLENN